MIDDQFERYYSEKLWDTIPAIYKTEDGIADNPGVLRALVQVMAQEAAILRRSQDSLWDDQFIELCNEWAVPYIGDLVATRLLSALNTRGRRIDVAKTIYYRRRKGTPRILEELISDISGWEGKLVEQFQKLGRARHGLDPFPQPFAGRYSGTLPGGWADLRNQRISELTNGPFEEYFHTPDVRLNNGLNGRYSIPKLAFYLYRLQAFPVINVTPFALADGLSFTFDPSGRDTWLFSQSLRADDWDDWHTALEWELPAPIPCRLLGHAEYEITPQSIQQLIGVGLSTAAAAELGQLSSLRFKDESSLVNIIETFTNEAEILAPANFTYLLSFTLVADCGKQVLLPDASTILTSPLETSSIIVGFNMPTNAIVSVENITAANLASWIVNTNVELAIDAENGRFKFTSLPLPGQDIYVDYHYGFSGNIGAGSYARPDVNNSTPTKTKSGGGAIISSDLLNSGITQIQDSQTYGPIADKLSITALVLQAANSQRPYICLQSSWTLSTGTNMASNLTLDGLWIGSAGNLNLEIILKGDYDCVTITNCTFDPGGSTNADGETLNQLILTIQGTIQNLCIESSIIGPINVAATGEVIELSISDSIVQSVDPTVNALQIGTGLTMLQNVTVYGQVNVHRLEASETLITDLVNVTDTQNGCFRFSAAPLSVAPNISRLPRPYQSYLFTDDTNHWFTSRRFGDAGYAQLSGTAPGAVNTGAENGSEMGAFSSLLNPIKFDGLQAKVGEYMPFGLIPIYINIT